MKKMTASKVYAAFIAITKISGEKMPASTAYKLARLKDKLKDIAVTYEKQRNALVQKHGTAKDGDVMFSIPPELVPAYRAELATIDIEEDVPDSTITEAELEGMSLSIENLEPLMPFVLEQKPLL